MSSSPLRNTFVHVNVKLWAPQAACFFSLCCLLSLLCRLQMTLKKLFSVGQPRSDPSTLQGFQSIQEGILSIMLMCFLHRLILVGGFNELRYSPPAVQHTRTPYYLTCQSIVCYCERKHEEIRICLHYLLLLLWNGNSTSLRYIVRNTVFKVENIF